MSRIVLKAKVGGDGILHLALSIGKTEADKEVQVTVESVPKPPMSQEEWQAFVKRTAGCIADPQFRRWDQGEYEKREPLS
jgi:hypothetical protein